MPEPRQHTHRRGLAILAVLLAAIAGRAQAQFVPGEILVADFEAGTGRAGALFRLSSSGGARVLLSDFGDPSQGPPGTSPFGVAVLDRDTVLVLDNQALSGAGMLFRVSASGVRSVLSDFADPAQGPTGVEPVGIFSGVGLLLVTDLEAGTDGRGALFRLDPASGARSLVSDFGNAAQGELGRTPTGITRADGGSIWVIDPDAGSDVPGDSKQGGHGALFRVDPGTGIRTLVSDFGNPAQGPTGVNPGGVAPGPGGALLVADTEAGTGAAGVLFRVDSLTGTRSVASTFGNLAQGPSGIDPFFPAVAATGHVLVSDFNGGTDIPLDDFISGNGALFSVDQTSGARTLLSDFGQATQGPTGAQPVGVAVVPFSSPSDVLVISPFTGTNGGGELIGIDPISGRRVRISDFGNPLQGQIGFDPWDVALGVGDDVWVVDEDLFGGGALFRVNRANGVRGVVASFANPTNQGQPHGVVLDRDRSVLVVTLNQGTDNRGALWRIDPRTGARAMLSDFGDPSQGPIATGPEGIDLDGAGRAIVVDPEARQGTASASGLLFSVDLSTGARTVVSDFSNPAQGLSGVDPFGVWVEADDSVLITDLQASQMSTNFGAVFRVNPLSGARTLLSDLGDLAEGPRGPNPHGIAPGPGGVPLVVDNAAGTGGVGALFAVDPIAGTRALQSDFGQPLQGESGARPTGIAAERDGDLLPDSADNCPGTANPDQEDADGDARGDACDNCRIWPNPDQVDADGNALGNACECGDQSGDGRVNVQDLIAINQAIFNPALATPLCDTNADDRCDVRDIVGANLRIFGAPAYCARNPRP